MRPLCTVIIPTYDHGETLYSSVRSVIDQRLRNFELLIIGDGATPKTKHVASELAALDQRITFIEYPKHPRRGEPYRHEVITTRARGEFICYLCDDDLWLPNHLEYMAELLQNNDVAHPLSCFVDAYGELQIRPLDLGEPFYRQMMLGRENRIGLSSMAHTMDFYKRLPYGWRTTPTGLLTDLYMYQQFLSQPDVRVASGSKPTLINFPDGFRQHLSKEQKVTELQRWSRKMRAPGFEAEYTRLVLAAAHRKAAELERLLTSKLHDVIGQRDEMLASAHAYKKHAEALEQDRNHTLKDVRELQTSVRDLERALKQAQPQAQ